MKKKDTKKGKIKKMESEGAPQLDKKDQLGLPQDIDLRKFLGCGG